MRAIIIIMLLTSCSPKLTPKRGTHQRDVKYFIISFTIGFAVTTHFVE